jgi:CubicO group peptidase (beta-lactamase class C family)
MLDRNNDGIVTKEEAAAFAGSGARQGQGWRGVGVSEGAPLPPAEGFQPRPHGDEATAAGLDPEVLARIDIEMQRHVAAKNIAGLIGLIHRNGQRGYFEAFGMQDIESGKPMAKDSIFRLMSMTKPVIAVTALVLYDEGKFTLDEPISRHCPEWAEPKVFENGQLVPAKYPITPRTLMSHSSGLYYGNLEGAPKSGGGDVAAMAYQAMRGGRATLKDFSELAAKEPLKFQPGTDWNYGISIDILGRYIEAVTDQPLDVVIREKLTGPLKMVDTDFWVPPDKVARLCQIYKQPSPGVLQPGRDAAEPTEKPTLFMGGHGMLSTAGDYERFCRMVLNGGELDGVRVLKPETVDLMFQNHVPPPGQMYGLGGVVDGKGSYGWGGADGTQFWIDRTNQLFAVFMTQTDWYKAPTYQAFRVLVFEAAGVEAARQWAPAAGGAGQ